MTPQERAAELCFKLALLVDADTHMEVDQDAMKAITEALTATRRAALLEAADIAFDHACDDPQWCTCNSVICRALTKLAQEG